MLKFFFVLVVPYENLSWVDPSNYNRFQGATFLFGMASCLRSLSQHRFDGMEPLVLSFKKTLEAQQLRGLSGEIGFEYVHMCPIIAKSFGWFQ